MNSWAYILGFICGLLVVALVAFVIGFIVKKSMPKGKDYKYDERQEAIRGVIFKRAFFTLLIYNLAYGVFDLATGIVWCDRFVGVFIGIFIAVTVFAVDSILKGAYFRVDENPRAWSVIIGLLSIFNVALGISRAMDGDIIVDGMLTIHSTNLLIAAMFLAVLIAMWVKNSRDERSEEMETDE